MFPFPSRITSDPHSSMLNFVTSSIGGSTQLAKQVCRPSRTVSIVVPPVSIHCWFTQWFCSMLIDITWSILSKNLSSIESIWLSRKLMSKSIRLLAKRFPSIADSWLTASETYTWLLKDEKSVGGNSVKLLAPKSFKCGFVNLLDCVWKQVNFVQIVCSGKCILTNELNWVSVWNESLKIFGMTESVCLDFQ